MPSLSIIVALSVAAASSIAFVLNEWSQGGVSEALGTGHHHLTSWDMTSSCGALHPMHTSGPACAANQSPSQGLVLSP